MWIAQICFQIPNPLEDQYIPVGKIWHDPKDDTAFIRLATLPLGTTKLFAKAFDEVKDPPCIIGDIIIRGNNLPNSTERRVFQLGHIFTTNGDSAEHTAIYQISLWANPMPLLYSRQTKEDTKRGAGIILSIVQD